jgi:hypothetical protein
MSNAKVRARRRRRNARAARNERARFIASVDWPDAIRRFYAGRPLPLRTRAWVKMLTFGERMFFGGLTRKVPQ